MIGAIIGDIVGSRFEFHNRKSKDFTLFTPECFFTDDTVMTLAIAKALNKYEAITDYEDFKLTLIKSMHEIGNHYPNCGYGGRFYGWIRNRRTTPYNSYGNGSAMRVSPVGWCAKSLDEAERLAKATAVVTHNHPEGIKGAVSVAGAIYLARMGSTMNEIKKYVRVCNSTAMRIYLESLFICLIRTFIFKQIQIAGCLIKQITVNICINT